MTTGMKFKMEIKENGQGLILIDLQAAQSILEKIHILAHIQMEAGNLESVIQ